MGGPRYSEDEARRAIAESRSFAEALRGLDMCASGNNWRTLKRYALEVWRIPVAHFDPHAASRDALRRNHRAPTPLEEVLVEGSAFSRVQLKQRLYAEGLKTPVCELCGQGELWRGLRMSLILDHVNGVSDDHRLENLRILCPNCAATLATHCGRNVRRLRKCAACGTEFKPAGSKQRHCSHRCGARSEASRAAQQARRKVRARPPYEELVAEIAATSWSAVGRRYGVSDNAIRKWVRAYEAERASVAEDGAAAAGEGEEPVVVVREREHGGVADPGRVLGGDGRGEQVVRRERAAGERFEDLALEAGEAAA